MKTINIETYLDFVKFRFEDNNKRQILKFFHKHIIINNLYNFDKIF